MSVGEPGGRIIRQLVHRVTLGYQEPDCCRDVLYHRLNEDYRPLHALCRFFLEHSGPAHQRGERAMVPFIIYMAGLFEKFVARWLAAHPPPGLYAQSQHRLLCEPALKFARQVDLVFTDERLVCELEDMLAGGKAL